MGYVKLPLNVNVCICGVCWVSVISCLASIAPIVSTWIHSDHNNVVITLHHSCDGHSALQ